MVVQSSYYIQPWINDTEFQDPQTETPVTYNWSGNLTLLTMYVQPGTTVNNLVIKPMLNAGTTALPYQPYFKGLKNAYFKKIVSTGKNLIPYPYSENTITRSGVTFTVNNDGSIIANGTATENTNFSIYTGNMSLSGEFTLSGCVGGSANTYYLRPWIDGVSQNAQFNEAITYNWSGRLTTFRIYVASGATLNNVVFRPMLNFGTTAEPFELYKQSVLSLPSPIENPAYNTLDFQTGKNISQGATKVFDGTEVWGLLNTSYRAFYTSILAPNNTESICNIYERVTTFADLKNRKYIIYSDTLSINDEDYSTVDEWKAYLAEKYAAGDPVMVRYKTAEVQSEADLNASSDRYIAWKGGSETIVQGDVDNSEYGAENTVTQDYFTITGGTTNES